MLDSTFLHSGSLGDDLSTFWEESIKNKMADGSHLEKNSSGLCGHLSDIFLHHWSRPSLSNVFFGELILMIWASSS